MAVKKIVMYFTIALMIVFAGTVLTSCGAADYSENRGVQSDETVVSKENLAPGDVGDRQEDSVPAPAPPWVNGGMVGDNVLRHEIRNGSIDLTVKDTRETVRNIRLMVTREKGIVSNSSVFVVKEGLYGAYMTLRIPVARFDALMEQLETLGEAANVSAGAQDVTMQYLDLESRLNNQKAQEIRLLEILEIAKTVEEVLQVEKELFRVRGEIESMTAQFAYLQDQVVFSTINVSLTEEDIPTEAISPRPFENLGSRMMKAFIGSINFMLNVISRIIIALTALLPALLIMALLVTVSWHTVRKLSRRKPPVENK